MSISSQTSIQDAPRVDAHQGKFAQGSTVLLTALAFLLNQPVLVLITAILMTWAALLPAANPYLWLYQHIGVPSGLLKPRIVEEEGFPNTTSAVQ